MTQELTGHSKLVADKKPGITRKPNHFDWNVEKLIFADLPGLGFMSGVGCSTREAIKTDVVQYIEEHTDDILAAVLVVNGKSVIDIIDHHTAEDSVPHDVEVFFFPDELNILTMVAVNKMDKVDSRDERLNDLCDRLDLLSPWKQWQNVIAPITARRGDIPHLGDTLRSHLHKQGRDNLFRFL